MERPVLYIFSKRQEILSSISRYIRHTGFECKKLKHRFDPNEHAKTYSFLEEITSILNKEPHETLLNAVAIIDVTDVDNDISSSLNPVEDSNETGQIVSSLILAYPEVYWIILSTPDNISSNSSDNESYLKEEHFVDTTNMEGVIKLLQCHQDGYRPLFDPAGLRTWIKKNVAEKEKAKEKTAGKSINEDMIKMFEKRTKQCAVTLDEEVPFTFLNSYVAYRFGYRCYMITTKAEMDKRLTTKFQQRVQLSFEDKDLRFYDIKWDEEDEESDINDLKKRQKKYDSLPDNNHRVIVTGVSLDKDEKEIFKNIIRKPYSGIFDLADKSGIYKEKTHHQASQEIQEINTARHSAPNKILFIANILLDRARKVAKEINKCEDAVHALILALEAKEILHGRSMTTALEAISIQHQMEVRAECSFYGVAYEIYTGKRFNEINNEVDETISSSNKEESKLAQSYNAQLEIVNNIRLIFKEYEQFDEEELCLIKVRDLRRKLHKHKYSTLASSKKCVKKSFNWAYTFFIEKYFNCLIATRSYVPWKTLCSAAAWILVFFVFIALYYFLTNPQQLEVGSSDFCVSEFKAPITIRNLCKEINKDRYNIPLTMKRNTIFWLNELLKVPDFYDILSKGKTSFSKNIIVLVEETNSYRKNTSYSNLSTDKQNNIKKLNRLLLEETYPLATPKGRNDNSESFSWQRLGLCLGQSGLTFIEMQDAGIIECQRNWVFKLVLFLELVIAYVHLGIFITYFYQKLSRR